MPPIAVVLALGALFLGAVEASADPVTSRTITGYSAAAATQQGKPLEVPVGQGPMQDAAPAPVAAEAGAEAGAGGQSVTVQSAGAAAPAPRKIRYGLFGLSWRSQ